MYHKIRSSLYTQKAQKCQQHSISSTKCTMAGIPLRRVGLTALLLGVTGAIKLVFCHNYEQLNAIAQIPISAKLIYVDSTVGTDNNAISQATPYRTITYALQKATAGTVIQLAPGKYTFESGEVFPLALKSGVTVQGNEATKGKNILIIGGGGAISPTFAGQNVTIWANDNSTIKGVTIINPNTRGTGLWIESGNPIVQNNTFVNNQREGIFITGTAIPQIEDNIFTKNQGQGISITRAAKGEIKGNLFQEMGLGLVIDDDAAPLLINNRIVNNLDGIVISGSAHPVLRENAIENNKRDGVVAITNAQPDLGTPSSPGNNTIRNNGGCGLNNLTKINILSFTGNVIENQCLTYSKP